MKLIERFQDSVGSEFWDHFCIIVNGWSMSPYDTDSRLYSVKGDQLTVLSRREQIMEALSNRFPDLKDKQVPIFYFDSSELN